ncbi:hypothetical protein WA538_005192, partial [Blastocystis sp. DL]
MLELRLASTTLSSLFDQRFRTNTPSHNHLQFILLISFILLAVLLQLSSELILVHLLAVLHIKLDRSVVLLLLLLLFLLLGRQFDLGLQLQRVDLERLLHQRVQTSCKVVHVV